MNTVSSPTRPRRTLARPHPLRYLHEAWRHLCYRHAVRQMSEQIRIDLKETAQAYTVLASLPGANKDDIEVWLDGYHVRIGIRTSAEHAQHEGASTLRRERYVGRRHRTLTLAQEVDASRSSAEYRHGVLKLVLAKAGEQRGMPVPVR